MKSGNEKGTENEGGRRRGLPRPLVILIGAAIFLAGAYVGGRWLYYRFTHATTENAFVKTDMVNLSPLVPGKIKKLFVDEGETVAAGHVLAKIDDRDLRKVVELKRAALVRAKKEADHLRLTISRTAEEIEKNITVAGKALTAAREERNALLADIERAEKDFRRISNLLRDGSISQSRFDAAKAALDALRARKRSLEATDELRKAEVDKALIQRTRVKELKKSLETLKAGIKVAQKDLDAAMINLEHTEIRSPIDGLVAKRYFNEGDFVSPGMPLFALYDPENLYVTANLEETKLRGVRLGQPVDLTLDAYPRKTFTGRVILIGKAAGAEFALIPRGVSAGEFTKVVQRVPIKISVPSEGRIFFRPGLSVAVGIDTRR